MGLKRDDGGCKCVRVEGVGLAEGSGCTQGGGEVCKQGLSCILINHD